MSLFLPDGVTVYEPDIDALVHASRNNVILSGGQVTAQAVPNMSVKGAAGTMIFNGAIVPIVAADPLTISAASPSNPRIDLIEIDGATGVFSVKVGTPAASPKPPVLTSGRMFSAYVSVGINAVNIQSSNISDRRIVEAPSQLTAGPLASRPSATIASGLVYFANDTRTLTRSNGTTWDDLIGASTVLGIGDGAAATPSLYFTNDTDTGIYRVGNNNFRAVGGGRGIIDFLDQGGGAQDFIQVVNGTGTAYVQIGGVSADVTLSLSSKGAGSVNLYSGTGGRVLATFTNVASSINWIDISPSSTGNAPVMQAVGAESNIALFISSKGTGGVQMRTGNQARVVSNFIDVPSSVNYFTFQPGTAGGSIYEYPGGTDANIGTIVASKGVGTVQLMSGAAGNNMLVLPAVAGSVNWVEIVSATAGTSPHINVSGTDANVSLFFFQKGTGNISFYTNSGAAGPALVILGNAGYVNNLQITPSVTGVAVDVAPAGSDANIDLKLSPKGTGVIAFNYTTNALGGGAGATLGTIGGGGPTVAAQNSWMKIKVNATTTCWFPVWV